MTSETDFAPDDEPARTNADESPFGWGSSVRRAAPSPRRRDAAAELIEVSRAYPGGVTALSDVTFSIDRGKFVAIVGPSGSGKSIMLNLLGTLEDPSVALRLLG